MNLIPERPKPVGAVAEVEAMPRRMAHALHALLQCHEEHILAPQVEDIITFDEEAFTTRSTAAALREASKRGYCGCGGGTWFTYPKAGDLRAELEDRYLREVDR